VGENDDGGYCERYVGRLVMKQVPARGKILKRKVKIKERKSKDS